MSMKAGRDYVDYLQDILGHAEAAIGFVATISDSEALAADRRTFWAVIRALEVIGEAARHVPADFRQAHPEIAWRGMTGMRDKVIHDYFGVDAAVVWRTVKEDLPPLCEAIRRVLEDWDDGDSSSAHGDCEPAGDAPK
jgi:uncharacterized protein with HEPN domain